MTNNNIGFDQEANSSHSLTGPQTVPLSQQGNQPTVHSAQTTDTVARQSGMTEDQTGQTKPTDKTGSVNGTVSGSGSGSGTASNNNAEFTREQYTAVMRSKEQEQCLQTVQEMGHNARLNARKDASGVNEND